MKIIPLAESIFVNRDDNSKINYFIFDEYGVHYGEIEPGVKQPWHSHNKINETIFVIEGQIELHSLKDKKKIIEVVKTGDLIQVEDTPHTFMNTFDKVCKMIVFRFIPDGKYKQDQIKTDKTLFQELD